jgi:rRNA small subunit pseudouridine methyltransferase Nep1
MLNLLFVETSLELVPRQIARHPSVVRNAKREGKKADEVILDRSLHHHAMLSLPEGEKRGRPDIIHFCLLEALGAPLNKTGKLRPMVHTLNSDLLVVSPELRLPRDCYRFRSLIEQLFAAGRVPPDGDKPLITLSNRRLGEVKRDINPSHTLALTSHGKVKNLSDLCKDLAAESNPLVFIGAYPHGAMRDETLALADDKVSIYRDVLEAWVITSRFVYEYERALGLE